MPSRPRKAALGQAGWSSVPVAKPICVSPLECPSENTRWAWEGDESPLASSQLSCRGAPPPSYHALPSSLLPFPLHSSTSTPLPYCAPHAFSQAALLPKSVCVHKVDKALPHRTAAALTLQKKKKRGKY